jgi:hypothetical protein
LDTGTMIRRPFSSCRESTPSAAIASVTVRSTSVGVCALSMTSSRAAYCTPILTSTGVLLFRANTALLAESVPQGRLADPPG